MPESPEAAINFEQMLEELATTYPSIKEQALELKDEIIDLMPEEAPMEEPELDLEMDEDEDEITLEL